MFTVAANPEAYAKPEVKRETNEIWLINKKVFFQYI